MQAIVTSFCGPTDRLGMRIIARCQAGRITVPYGRFSSDDSEHRNAALALCEKLGWSSAGLVSGTLPNGDRVFVFADRL